MKLTIVPFEGVSADLPRAVVRRLRRILPWRFVVAIPISTPAPCTQAVLQDVGLYWPMLPRSIAHDEIAVGITACGLKTSNLGAVFGFAVPELRIAMVSLSPLAEGTVDRRNGRSLLLERTTKEVLHEAGHLMGLSHCSRTDCVMLYSQTLHDTDIKQVRFCSNCLREMSRLPEQAADGWGGSHGIRPR